VPSPRALKSKKARTRAGSTQDLDTGSTSAPLLEDVSSLFFLLVISFACRISLP
jgi:hypothetical protein